MKKVKVNTDTIIAILNNISDIKEYFEVLNSKIDTVLSIKTQPGFDDLIFLDEVCTLTNLKRNTVYMLTCHDKIPFIKPNGTKKLMFSRTAILKWLQNDKTDK